MKRTGTLLGALILVTAACGGNDADSGPTTTSASGGSTTATSAAPATTAAPTTTAAPLTTTTEAAPDLSPAQAFIAAAAGHLGEYRGTWDNDTFGSTGDLYINVLEANPGTIDNVLIQVDVDGFAFGAEDPDLFVVEIWVEGGELAGGATGFLGDFEFDVADDGSFTVVANPPLLDGMTLEITGAVDEDEGFRGTYVIPGLAEGSWSAAPSA